MSDTGDGKSGRRGGGFGGKGGRGGAAGGGKRPFGAKPRGEGERRPASKAAPREGGEDRKPFRPRPDGGGDARKPFAKGPRRDGEEARKPFRPRPDGAEGAKPYRPRPESRAGEGGEERRTFRPRPDGAAGAKPYRPRPERAAGEGGEERRTFRPRPDGAEGAKPYRPRPESRDGEGGEERRTFRPRPEGAEGGKPYRPRPERAAGEGGEERRTYRPRPDGAEGAKPYRPRSERPAGDGGGERRTFRSRPEGAEGAKPFRPRPERREASQDGAAPRRERTFRAPDEDGGKRFPPRTASGPRVARVARPEAEADEPAGSMRIAKRLARAGIASRRDAEAMIVDGRVRLNGRLIETPAVTVTARDRIEIDGQALPPIERTRLWLFHKPAGLVTTNRDPEGRATVFDRLPEDLPRVLTVGRLDINTEGLLLLTNDGGLARTLELPATGWLRRYRVRAHGSVSQAQLDELKHGIAIDGVFYGAIEASLDSEKGANVWLTLGLREGKNREVKRILGYLGLEVNRLIRISFGPFQLGELEEGAVREIKGRTLRDQLGERLIEEAGADFDAPIVNTFTNAAVTREEPAEEGRKPRREAPSKEWVSAGGPGKPSRKEFGMEKRESALARLGTRPDFKGERPPRGEGSERKPREGGFDGARKPRRDAGEDEARAPRKSPAGGRRTANVWIAPGSRPVGEKRAAERAAKEAEGDKPLRSRGFRDQPAGAAAGDKPRRSAGFRDAPAGRSFDKPKRPRGGDESGDKPRGRG